MKQSGTGTGINSTGVLGEGFKLDKVMSFILNQLFHFNYYYHNLLYVYLFSTNNLLYTCDLF